MADENGNGQTTETAETQNQQLQQSQQTAPPQQTTGHREPPPFVNDLKVALDALPEKVANAIAEAFPKPTSTPAQSAPAKSESTTSGEGTGDDKKTAEKTNQRAAQQTQVPPGRKNFREWWTGAPAGSIRD